MKNIITLRTVSGVSGDMLLCGFARLIEALPKDLDRMISGLGLTALKKSLRIAEHSVNHIAGWQAKIKISPDHGRSFRDIEAIIKKSQMSAWAKKRSLKAFSLLAKTEGQIHGIKASEVTFHEIGGLDSILDICLSVLLFEKLCAQRFVCSPLPLCDGVIHCSHGQLLSPAPAVLGLLDDVSVRGIKSRGETVTPTALSVLKALDVEFGPWPKMRIKKSALVYGSRLVPNVPNGAIFALGISK